MSFARATWLLARKDLLLEARSREVASAMALFALAGLVLLHFATAAGTGSDSARAASGLLWLVVLLVALLGLQRSFAAERDEGLLDALVLAPIDRAAIWASKALSLIVLLAALEVVLVPLFWLMFVAGADDPGPSLPVLIAALALANVGLGGVGSLLATLASAARQREVLLPVLFLPAVMPLMIAGVSASIASADGDSAARHLALIALYDAVIGVLAWGAYEYVITE